MMMLLFTIFTTDSVFGQSDTINVETFPRAYVVNGDTLGIILSMEQAQRVDSDMELIQMYRELIMSYDELDTTYVGVIRVLDDKIEVLEIKVNEYIELDRKNNSIISNLKLQIDKYEENSDKCDEIISSEIDLRKENKKIKKQRLWGGITGGSIIVGLILLLIIK